MTKLIAVRGPTPAEAEKGAQVVFERRDARGKRRVIFAGVCHESWEQWGETRDLLADNGPAVEAWRRGLDAVLALVEPDD